MCILGTLCRAEDHAGHCLHLPPYLRWCLLVTTASQDPPMSVSHPTARARGLPIVESEDWSSNLHARTASVLPTRSSFPCPHCIPPYFLREGLSPSLKLSLSAGVGGHLGKILSVFSSLGFQMLVTHPTLYRSERPDSPSTQALCPLSHLLHPNLCFVLIHPNKQASSSAAAAYPALLSLCP